jgi:hypothetical protein
MSLPGAFLTTPSGKQIRVVSARLFIPWRGSWHADLDLDPDRIADLPNASQGRITLSIGPQTFVGTVDPRWSGSFVATGKIRIVSGGAGWDQPVTPKQYVADNGVLSTVVYQDAAALVKETVIEDAPTTLGLKFVRAAGPASQVFSHTNWWTDFTGTTRVGTRTTIVPDSSFELLDWDPAQRSGTATCDVQIVPGWVFTDSRIAAPVTVRDVEQTYDRRGVRATIWVADAATTRLASALANMVHEMGSLRTLRHYRYRIVSQAGDGRLTLQVVNPAAGVPDQIAISYFGPQGVKEKVKLSGEVLLVFRDGKMADPIVAGFDPGGGPPLEATFDASLATHVGPSSASVDIAGGTQLVALSNLVFTELGKIAVILNGIVGPGTYTPLPVAAAKTKAG